MVITFKYFGLIADITQIQEEIITVEENTIVLSILKSRIEDKYAELKNNNYTIAVNQSMSSLDILIKNNDVIAFMPPFAGG